MSAYTSGVKEQAKTCTCMHSLIKKIPTPTFCTHIDDCMHVWTHTTSAFYVSRPDKKQSNTQTIHTRVRYSMYASCVNLLTFFLTSFFFLSSSFLFFSSLIWARRCFLRSSSAFRSLLSDMLSVLQGFKEEDRTGMSYIWHCHNMLWFHCYMIQYEDEEVYPVMLQKTHWVWQLHIHIKWINNIAGPATNMDLILAKQLSILVPTEPRGISTLVWHLYLFL